MAATMKKKVKLLKEGSKIIIPKQTCVVRMKKKIEGASVGDDNIFVLKLSGVKGELKGIVFDTVAFGDSEIELIRKNPWPRQLYDYVACKLWRAAT